MIPKSNKISKIKVLEKDNNNNNNNKETNKKNIIKNIVDINNYNSDIIVDNSQINSNNIFKDFCIFNNLDINNCITNNITDSNIHNLIFDDQRAQWLLAYLNNICNKPNYNEFNVNSFLNSMITLSLYNDDKLPLVINNEYSFLIKIINVCQKDFLVILKGYDYFGNLINILITQNIFNNKNNSEDEKEFNYCEYLEFCKLKFVFNNDNLIYAKKIKLHKMNNCLDYCERTYVFIASNLKELVILNI